VQPEKVGGDIPLEPHRSNVDPDAQKRKGNQPGARPGSHIEKHDDRTGQDEYQAHTEKVNVGPLQRSDKLFALVDRFLFYILSSVVEKFYTT
jgi:hypothetical protein